MAQPPHLPYEVMQPDKAEKPADISAIIDLALLYNPNLAMADLSTPRMWVAEGCAIKTDILPTMQQIMKRKQGITAFRYFTNAILEARDKRLVAQKTAKQAVEQPEAYYISIYKWKRQRGISLGMVEEQKLKEYEARENETAF